jgi:hypothetical protein
MKEKGAIALCDYYEALNVIRAAHPDFVNKRRLG